jgi:hypothetical protein
MKLSPLTELSHMYQKEGPAERSNIRLPGGSVRAVVDVVMVGVRALQRCDDLVVDQHLCTVASPALSLEKPATGSRDHVTLRNRHCGNGEMAHD